MYLKITNEAECHHGLQYHDGLIIDPAFEGHLEVIKSLVRSNKVLSRKRS
jgi:hypothetical protein